jgi:hypothetical protein
MLTRNEIAGTRPLTPPRIHLVRMAVFLILTGFIVFILYKTLLAAFMANPFLNGVIVGVLLIGIVLAIRQVWRLFREVRWVNELGGAGEQRPAGQPVLLAPMAALIGNRAGRASLSVMTTRSLLDSIAARLDENRELVRYLAGLLVFLGLLGTFWGLIETVGSVGKVIESMRTGAADAGVLFDELKSGLAQPLRGMGLSFSASLFGLAGSLILGFLDLQAGQAQSRFYTELEDWLAQATTDAVGTDLVHPGASPEIALALNKLAAAMHDGAGGRAATQAMANLAEGIQGLVQHMRAEQQMIRDWVEAQAAREKELKQVLDRLSRERIT